MESQIIEFEIREEPETSRAPQVTRWGVFDPKKEKKNLFRMNLKDIIKNPNMDRQVAVSLDIVFYIAIPRHTSKVKVEKMLSNEIKHIKKPDADNLQKFLLDTLKGIGFYDDSQIWQLNVRKMYSWEPRTSVKITYS